MTDDPDDRPQLRCISCGYDLRGLPPEGVAQTAFQCPECGAVNEITAIIHEHQRRQRSTRDLVNAALIGLVVTALVALGRALLAPVNIEINAVSVIAFLGAFGFSCFAAIGYYGVSHLAAVIFALGTAVLISVMLSLDVGRGAPTALLFLWVVGFINWAKSR